MICNYWVATIWCAIKYPWYLYFFSLSKCCCLHFCRNKFRLLLVRGYFKGQRSRIYHRLQLFMTLCDMQSWSGNYSMRHQVPMVFLLLLIYLSAVACISEERNLGPCWRKDILRVKGQAQIKQNFCMWVGTINMNLLSGHYVMRRQVSMPFLLLLLYLITAACILEISLGSCWHKGECMGQRSTINHNVQLFISFNNQYAIIMIIQ